MMRSAVVRFTGRVLVQLVVPVALVALWWYTSTNSTSIFYPPLSEVIDALRSNWFFDRVTTDLLPSLGRFGLGYVLSAVAGVTIGLLLGLVDPLRRATSPVVEFLRAIPPPLLIPFAFLVLGFGTTAQVFVIVLGSVWPILLNTTDGVRGIDRQAIDMARSFGVSRRQQIARVILPSASPQIMVGMRTALSIAIILMIISEMMPGTTNGLGYQVRSAERSFDTADMFAGIVVIGLVGVALNVVFVAAERRIMRWYRGAQGLE